jgi:hypothetical protein
VKREREMRKKMDGNNKEKKSKKKTDRQQTKSTIS